MKRPIAERMAEALHRMRDGLDGHGHKCRPQVARAFYLNADDYAEYVGTGPDYDWRPFFKGGRPSEQFCPLFESLAVRQSDAKVGTKGKLQSKLYSCAGTAIMVREA